jgi:hypothetical protein
VPDESTRWFDDDPEPAPRSRRLPVLLVVAAVPWVLVAALVQRGPAEPQPRTAPMAAVDQADGSSAPTTGDDPPEPEELDQVPPADGDGQVGRGELDAPDDDGQLVPPPVAPTGPRGDAPPSPTQVLHGVAEALVVAITRAWLSDGGPDVDAPGIEVDRRGYLEHVAVERVELTSPDLAVATVTVVLLGRDGGSYVDAEVRRAAVPLAVEATTVHPAGTPWWLADPVDLTLRPPETEPVEDELVSRTVGDALAAAGFRDTTVRDVRRTGDATLVADVTATTPAGDLVEGDLWLAETADGAVVLGHHDDAT